MARISPDDNLFATVISRGREVFSFQGKGISGFPDLLEKLRDHTPGCGGMVTINVRNSSQGWSHSQAIYLS